jgi:prepilin-type N-terminal cleavage/methylation domain-containing protein/prepilin-type processing-associated H-X9-DG protein
MCHSYRKTIGRRLRFHVPRGFTLVELLVVITIIGILIALLLPAVQTAREAARRVSCGNNMKQIGLAMHLYNSTNGRLPSGYGYGLNQAAWSWSAIILPFMDQKNITDNIDFSVPYYSGGNASNMALIKTYVSTYLCPSCNTPSKWAVCCGAFPDPHEDAAEMHYGGIATDVKQDYGYVPDGGKASGCLYTNSYVTLESIADGSSQTLLVGERVPFPSDDAWKVSNPICPGGACNLALNWAGNSKITTFWGINGGQTSGLQYLESGVVSQHPGGATFTFADAHVTFLNDTIEQPVLRSLTTRDGMSADGTTADILLTAD